MEKTVIDHTNDTTLVYAHIEKLAKDLINEDGYDSQNVADTLVESIPHDDICVESVIAQWLMNHLNANGSVGDKQTLLKIGEHMGPGWVQSLYHSAVWMTRAI